MSSSGVAKRNGFQRGMNPVRRNIDRAIERSIVMTYRGDGDVLLGGIGDGDGDGSARYAQLVAQQRSAFGPSPFAAAGVAVGAPAAAAPKSELTVDVILHADSPFDTLYEERSGYVDAAHDARELAAIAKPPRAKKTGEERGASKRQADRDLADLTLGQLATSARRGAGPAAASVNSALIALALNRQQGAPASAFIE